MAIGLKIEKILFLGDSKDSSISFNKAVHIVHGASNTGKSLLVEAIDYMLGAKELKQVEPESQNYNEIAMQIYLNSEPFTVFRKWPSLNFEVYHGLVDSKEGALFFNYFKHGKPTKDVNNITDFYLEEHKNTDILSNLYGEKSSLTIRLLSRVVLSSEEKIIQSNSPIIAGDTNENSKNKYVFKYLLTGKDDSHIETVVRKKEFKSENKGKIETLNDVVGKLKLNLTFPDETFECLTSRANKLDVSIDGLLEHIDFSREKLSEIVESKKKVSLELINVTDRVNSIKVNLVNFNTLKKLYLSDIERLKSQEESAFLLKVGHHGECDFCGNSSKRICQDLSNVKLLADASNAEIKKIQSKYIQLEKTTDVLEQQLVSFNLNVSELKTRLKFLDDEVERRSPDLKSEDKMLTAMRKERSLIKFDLELQNHIRSFTKGLQEIQLTPVPKQYNSKDFYPESGAIDSFCQIYRDILLSIKFPGDNKVTFDYNDFDVVIDEKPRKLNGKGVRAILHSVFKIALLKHCRKHGLYHPGLVILDSPLVTYRDPLKSKHGKLKKDEAQLAETKVSYHFLNYLNENKHMGQFIIIENIDVPEPLRNVISVDTFYGENASLDERKGLL